MINYWADDGKGGLVKENFDALLYAYSQHVKLENVDWDPVFAGSFFGMLGWLEYNMKRVLGIENGSTDDAQAGKEQVLGTIGALYDYQKKIQMMKQWLE